MTQREFTDKYKHVILGLILDGAVSERRGSQLGMFACLADTKTEQILAAIYKELTPKEELRVATVPMNGVKRA